jgi:putative intracellular protease/amidase
MTQELSGQRVGILAADGVERIELEQPRGALHGAGAQRPTSFLRRNNGPFREGQTTHLSAWRVGAAFVQAVFSDEITLTARFSTTTSG